MKKAKITKKTGSKKVNKNIVEEIKYDEHYVQIYQECFDRLYPLLTNGKLKVYYYLLSKLSDSNVLFINKRLRGEFTAECVKRGDNYPDREVIRAITDLTRSDERYLIRLQKGLYCFNPLHVWIGTAESRKDKIKQLFKNNDIK